MKRFSKVVRPVHGARMGSTSGKEDPVITDRLKAEDFVFTKVCRKDMAGCSKLKMSNWGILTTTSRCWSFLADSSQTSRYGFPYQPTCVAYDPVQSLLAIGSYDGSLRMYPLSCFCTKFKRLHVVRNTPSSWVIFRELVRLKHFVLVFSEGNFLYLGDTKSQTTNVQKNSHSVVSVNK